jgi:hypothetical protein
MKGKELNNENEFQNFKVDLYTLIGIDSQTLFNFFFENNNYFHMISKEDEELLLQKNLVYLNRSCNYTIGSFFGVLFVDQIIMRKFFPTFRIPSFRLGVNLCKYVGVPLLGYKFSEVFHMREVTDVFEEMQRKYSFNYADYNKVMDSYGRDLYENAYKNKKK